MKCLCTDRTLNSPHFSNVSQFDHTQMQVILLLLVGALCNYGSACTSLMFFTDKTCATKEAFTFKSGNCYTGTIYVGDWYQIPSFSITCGPNQCTLLAFKDTSCQQRDTGVAPAYVRIVQFTRHILLLTSFLFLFLGFVVYRLVVLRATPYVLSGELLSTGHT